MAKQKPQEPAPAEQAAVTVVPIDTLLPDAANVRVRDEEAERMLVSSLKQFGAGRSIVLDGKDVVKAGNGTLKAAREAGVSEVLVVEPRPGQLVAVKRADWTPSQATAYSVADNRLAERAEWSDGLGEVLHSLREEGFDLEPMGFTLAEAEEYLPGQEGGGGGAEDPGAQMDRAEELLAVWKVKPGDLWIVPSHAVEGEHRLLCGDSTRGEDVARVMGDDKALLMNTDPPYGVAYSDEARVAAERAHGRPQRQEKWSEGIANDEMDGEQLQAFLEAAIRAAVPHLVENAAFYLWHPMLTQGTFFAAAAAAAADILIHRQIIWVKPSLLFGFGDYHWQHELCFYGWRRGHRPEFLGERNQTTIWDLRHDTAPADRNHPTQKPVMLFTRPIENHTRRRDVIYEPFSGSGSQFVAAEQTGRLCRGLELAPKYVSVALQRLSDMGLEPRLAG